MDTPDLDAVKEAASAPRPKHRYRGFIRRHLGALLVFPLMTGLLAAVFVMTLEPVFESSVLLIFASGPAGEGGSASSGVEEWDEWLRTQVLLLRSESLAERMAERLDLWTRPGLDPRRPAPSRAPVPVDWGRLMFHWFDDGATPITSSTPTQARAAALGALAAGLRAERVEGARVIRIAFRASDPEIAVEVANAYADLYLEQTQATAEGADGVGDQLERLRRRLDASEGRLRDYRELHGLSVAADSSIVGEESAEELSQRLVNERTKLNALRGDLDELRGLDLADLAAAASHPLLNDNQLIQSLRSDEVRSGQALANLGQRYGELHPKRIAAQIELDGIRASLRSEIDIATASVSKALDIAQARVLELQLAVAASKARASEMHRETPELATLEREVQSNRRLYERMLSRLENAAPLRVRSGAAVVSVMDRAQASAAAVAPARSLIVGAVILAALLLGILWAMLRERRNDQLLVPEAVERLIGLTTLGTLPVLSGKRSNRGAPERTFIDRPHSLYAEAIRTIRTAIVLRGMDRPHKVIMVTSSVPGEGKTTVAMNLAFALASNERVLLIDADLRRASVGNRLGLPDEASGLVELVSGAEDPEDCIHRIDATALDMIASGVLPPDPLEVLSSDALQSALAELSERYDRVLIDSPPLQAVSDALILSRSVDATLFVIKADSTPADFARRSVQRLYEAKAPLLGAVLNAYDAARAARRGQAPSGPGAYAHQGYTRYYRGIEGAD